MTYFLMFLPNAFIALLAITAGCSIIENYQQDNIVEEVAEEIILAECGLDIDLSPSTPEKK